MNLFVTGEVVFQAQLAADVSPQFAVTTERTELSEDGPHASVLSWLGRLRLLHGVPFTYLVPDDGLLRPETARFFHLDRRWNDALVEGALSVGTFDSRERTALDDAYPAVRAAVDDAERRERLEPPSSTLPAANVTGMLLRSGAVSGWPGLHVAATRRVGNGDPPVRLLRMERLSPAVLLVLFEDIPDQVTVAEPKAGLQFGATFRGGRWLLPVRDPKATDGRELGVDVNVPFRAGSSGVIHVKTLVQRLTAAEGVETGTPASGALALQLLRRPYVQPFGSRGPVGQGGQGGRDDGPVMRVELDTTWLAEAIRRAGGGPR